MNDQPQKVKCPDCDKEFDSPGALGPHRRQVHGYRKSDGKNHPRLAKKHTRTRTKRLAASHKLAGAFPCEACDFVAKWPGGLKKHMNAMHGHPSARQRRTERSTALVTTATPAVSEVKVSRNGYHHPEAEARRNLIPEATLAFTAGRVEELLKITAAEYDLPSRTFTAGVIELIVAKTLR